MDMKINKKRIIIDLILIIACCAISSLITIITYKNLKEENINYYDQNISKVVEVASYDDLNNKSYGTGWFIDNNTIVTNYHVISNLVNGTREQFDNIEIRFYDTVDYEIVTLFKFNEEKDIAIIKYNGDHKHSYFNTQENITISQKCFNIGNFSNYGLSFKEGYISLVSVELLYNNQYSIFIQCSINIGQGDSGSPVFNENNEVIGMITFRTKGLTGNVEQCFAYAIPISYILEEI